MYRYERKYLVPNNRLEELRNRIQPFLLPDNYAALQPSGIYQYTVRSIYFDTPSLDCFYEKIEGIEVRKKLRIRTYGSDPNAAAVFFEVKRKKGDRIWKDRSAVPFDAAMTLLNGTNGPNESLDKLDERSADGARKFLFHYHRNGYRPMNLISYEREPFKGKFDPGLRITFDKHIRARMWPSLTDLWSDDGLGLVWKDDFIIEIKYFTDTMPSWLRSVIQEFGLRNAALSKYATPYARKDISMYNIKIGA